MADRRMPAGWTRVPIREESDIGAARRRVRDLCERSGAAEPATEALATAVSEVARNILVYAREGELHIGLLEEPDRQGVAVRAQDRGPGIRDVQAAMTDGYSSGRGLGFGLPGARRMVDEFEIESAPGVGTTVTMCKWISGKGAR